MTKQLKQFLDEKQKNRKPELLKLNIQFFADGDEDKGGQGEGEKGNPLLTQIKSELKNAQDQLKAALEAQDKEIKNHGTTTDQTANKIKEAEKNFESIQAEMEDMKKSVNDLLKKSGRPGFGQEPQQIKTAGQLFAESEAFKQYQKSGDLNALRGRMTEIKHIFQKDITSTTTGAGNGGALIVPYRVPSIVEQAQRPLTIRSLLNTSPISTNAVSFIRETGFTNNAGYRAEGQPANKSEIAFEMITESVKTISHWMAASREVLDDAPRLQNFIDTRLINGLEYKEEDILLYGSGVNGEIRGIMNDDDIQNIGAPTAGRNMIDQIRHAMTKARLAQYRATGIVLHPEDWESIELAKGDDGHYIWLSVGSGNEQQLFKVPVVDTPAMEKGKFLTGAFAMGATLYDREAANVRVSEHHQDFFTRGMIAMLAEERAALTIERPEAFVTGTFGATTEG